MKPDDIIPKLDQEIDAFLRRAEHSLPPCPGKEELLQGPQPLLAYLVDLHALQSGSVAVLVDLSLLRIWVQHQLQLMPVKDEARLRQSVADRLRLIEDLEKTFTLRRQHLKEQAGLLKTLLSRVGPPPGPPPNDPSP